MAEDLWPLHIVAEKIMAPVVILKEQAALLGEKTGNQVVAEVRTSSEDSWFYLSFYLVAPALDNYKFRLFRVRHQIALYPLYLSWQDNENPIDSADGLTFRLREILNDESTIKVVRALIAQVNA
jgi:hypothetical protein